MKAPDVLLARSTRVTEMAAEMAQGAAARAGIQAENERLAALADNLLGGASRAIPAQASDPGGELMPLVAELTFQGLADIQDPPPARGARGHRPCAGAPASR